MKLDGDYTCCEDDEDEEKLRPVFGAVKAGPENDDPNGEGEEEREIIFEQPLDIGGFADTWNRSESVQASSSGSSVQCRSFLPAARLVLNGLQYFVLYL